MGLRDHAEMMKEASALMTELVDSLALLLWSELPPPPNQDGAVFYQGLGAGWIVTVGSWRPARGAGGRRGSGATPRSARL